MTTRGEFIEARLREELDFGTINTEVADAIRWITAFDATMADQAARTPVGEPGTADHFIASIYATRASATSAIVRRLAAAWEDHPDHPTEEHPQ